MRYLILSDLHLGHRSTRFPRVMAGLARVVARCDQVIINGDALNKFDSRDPGTRAQAEEWLGLLRKGLVGRQGAPCFVTGNHDPLISEMHFRYLEEARLLLFHGDMVHDRAAPWVPEERHFRRRLRSVLGGLSQRPGFVERSRVFRETQLLHYAEYPVDVGESGQLRYFADHFLTPSRFAAIGWYLYRYPARVAALARFFERPLRHVVFGHSHWPGRWELNGLSLYNTGSFMPFSRPFAVWVDGSQVEFAPLEKILGGSP